MVFLSRSSALFFPVLTESRKDDRGSDSFSDDLYDLLSLPLPPFVFIEIMRQEMVAAGGKMDHSRQTTDFRHFLL